MSKPTLERRLRFSVEQDLQLLREVVRQNPYEDVTRWKDVHENFVNESNVPFSLRTVKDHVHHLLNLYVNNTMKRRPKESVPQFNRKTKYLTDIMTYRRRCEDGINFTDNNELPKIKTSWNEDSEIDIQEDPLQVMLKVEPDDNNLEEEDSSIDEDLSLDFHKSKLDSEAKLKKKELALESRQLALKERQLKLEQDRFELDNMERTKRMELEKAEREMYMKVMMQNQAIISLFIEKRNKVNGITSQNLCIL